VSANADSPERLLIGGEEAEVGFRVADTPLASQLGERRSHLAGRNGREDRANLGKTGCRGRPRPAQRDRALARR
jgi:hypothetical protein